MLPGGPVGMDTAAQVPAPLPMGPGCSLNQRRYGPGSPQTLADHAAFHVDPTFGAALLVDDGDA
eukprot:15480640-Alexandrium_andersonii.AAC.1